nr:hypothetical protein Iba_chr03eCG6910 [Ipomoea batatas]
MTNQLKQNSKVNIPTNGEGTEDDKRGRIDDTHPAQTKMNAVLSLGIVSGRKIAFFLSQAEIYIKPYKSHPFLLALTEYCYDVAHEISSNLLINLYDYRVTGSSSIHHSWSSRFF